MQLRIFFFINFNKAHTLHMDAKLSETNEDIQMSNYVLIIKAHFKDLMESLNNTFI